MNNKPLGLDDPFAQLINGVRDHAIFLLDPNGRVASWNHGAERIKGYAPGEILGQHFSLFHTDEAKQRRWPDQELQLAGEQGRFEDEGWRVAKGGRQFWANVVITALRDDGGELRGFAKITRDLTESRRHAESLRASDERFRLLVDGVKDYAMFFMLDRDGRVTSWNGGAERIKGYKAQEIVGRHFSAFYPQEAIDKKWPEQELAIAREHGRFEDEGTRVRKNGAAFWANVVVTPLYDPQGALLGYAKVTRDLTERKRVETLEKAERRTNEFLAMLAHELRNPLAPISNALQLLARKPAADATEQWAREVLERQTGQMTRLVDDLLDVSRITRSAIALTKKSTDMCKVVRAAADASLQWMQSRSHALSLRLPDHELTVLGDELRLAQAMQNLLHNAARYTPAGGCIDVEARREDGAVVVAVRDNHLGMDGDMLLGVGLTLVQRLVAMHGGTVEARSPGPGKGSELVLRLPAAAAASTVAPRKAEPRARPQRSLRVLVVDDNQDAANALRLLLESDGHQVKMATDGVSGLALAREYRPDYLLLDIGLPRLSGYDIAASLRADPAMKAITIVAITGYGQVHDRTRTAAVGFDHHLTKPVEFTALQDLLSVRR